MAEANTLISSSATNIIKTPGSFQSKFNSQKLQPHNPSNFRVKASSSKRHDYSSLSINKQDCRTNRRRLITISTADGRWHGTWSCDYLVSLKDLNLADLIEDDAQRDAQVSINLCIQKHASFGLSVDGRIITSFTRKCSICSSPYCRQIDTNFNVWVLASNKDHDATHQLPEIGGDDPSVIYVKPGYEANLDSLIQDTIRLTTSTRDICSEACRKSEPTLSYIGKRNAASIDKRWCRLLELRNANLYNTNF
ncbi:pentatricopeptide repeat-containing protein [Hibiscus syriacus]|uniref:Pentatricopeptide repeat-containing protein n=1 Tax=Hibiscus syriacus TaxID=106335 RepID=A0A6A2XDK8_HIBSY|nr:large ribosomal RNA subunit accumulation protein YCED homolog 2, chloroplastic-like [Hibiscus syriacus]KAE8667690.1 pentatricopeptide repeat-containing protein [Hibiscus syriacus]